MKLLELATFLFVLTLGSFAGIYKVQAAESAPPPSTGDIDMNQFKNLETPTDSEKMRDSRIKVKMTCTDPQGHLIKKGEPGFEACLSRTQTPVINNPRTPESPNDPRSF